MDLEEVSETKYSLNIPLNYFESGLQRFTEKLATNENVTMKLIECKYFRSKINKSHCLVLIFCLYSIHNFTIV